MAKKKLPLNDPQLASFKAAMDEARANNCEHIGTSVIYDDKKECWVDEFGVETEPPFNCPDCGGEFCSDCFGANECKGCEV